MSTTMRLVDLPFTFEQFVASRRRTETLCADIGFDDGEPRAAAALTVSTAGCSIAPRRTTARAIGTSQTTDALYCSACYPRPNWLCHLPRWMRRLLAWLTGTPVSFSTWAPMDDDPAMRLDEIAFIVTHDGEIGGDA